MLKVWTNDCDYVIAESAADAEAICVELGAGTTDESEWCACDDASPFTFYGDGDRSGLGVTKTFSEWAAERGRGYFCTSEF